MIVAPGDAEPAVLREGSLPNGWAGSAPAGFAIGSSTEHHSGTASVYLAGFGGNNFAVISQLISPEAYRGKRIRFAAWVKQDTIRVTQASGLWMRIDGRSSVLALDNMTSRPLTGTADWHEVEIVLDVPATAIGVTVGALFGGIGTLHVDDFSLSVAADATPVTSPPMPSTAGDPSVFANLALAYSRSGATLRNPGLEPPAPIPAATTEWLSRVVVPLKTTDPNAPFDDLAPFGKMVGDAHIVGLGEGTHGTREFFQMKDRMLRYLVSQNGFTHFAIEATSPEADDMNRYVLTGQGDPKRLLSNLYFWTWNTQEVLDMIEWMRRWNESAPVAKRVQFAGFDMQSPGASIDSVLSFVQRVDPTKRAFIEQRYSCLDAYRNHGMQMSPKTAEYAKLSATSKHACASGLADVSSLVAENRAAFVAHESASAYEQVLHDARLVQQFEAMAGGSRFARDSAMAENVAWLREQAGPAAKFVLWAHNGHINDALGAMGGQLAKTYGTDYVKLGFAFGEGEFNSVAVGRGLMKFQTDFVPRGSIEEAFKSTGQAVALFDTRQIARGGAAASPLREPIAIRSIGSMYDSTRASQYFSTAKVPELFDLMVFVQRATASTLLPLTR